METNMIVSSIELKYILAHRCPPPPLGNATDEGRERDNTWGGGGLPTLPSLYHSTFQPSQRGFF